MEYQIQKENKLAQEKLFLIENEIQHLESYIKETGSNSFSDYLNHLREIKIVMELYLNGLPFSKIADKLSKSITWVTNRYWNGINARKDPNSSGISATLILKPIYESKIEMQEKTLKEDVMKFLEKIGFRLLESTLLYADKNKFSVDIIAENNGVKYFFELKVGFDNHSLQRAIGQIIIYQALQERIENCKYYIVFKKEGISKKGLESITSSNMLSDKILKKLSTLNIKISFFDNEFYPKIE